MKFHPNPYFLSYSIKNFYILSFIVGITLFALLSYGLHSKNLNFNHISPTDFNSHQRIMDVTDLPQVVVRPSFLEMKQAGLTDAEIAQLNLKQNIKK